MYYELNVDFLCSLSRYAGTLLCAGVLRLHLTTFTIIVIELMAIGPRETTGILLLQDTFEYFIDFSFL